MNSKLERITVRNAPQEYRYSLMREAPFALREPEHHLQIHLMDYWKVLAKHRWIVIASVLLFALSSAYITWRQPLVYRASLKLRIDHEQTNILPFNDASTWAYVPTEEYLKTQFEALTSRTLATRVIRSLNLERDSRFIRRAKPGLTNRALNRIKRAFSHRSENKKQPSTPQQKYTSTFSSHADALISRINVSPIKDSRVVLVSFDAGDPLLAADVVNAIASEYIQMNFETKYNSTIMASEFLGKQLVDVKKQVEESEERLVKFGQVHNIYSLGERENVIMQKLEDLNAALTQAQAERIQKESIWKMVRNSPAGPLPDTVGTPDIRALENTVAQLQQQYTKLRAVYKSDWWEVKQVANQLETAQKQLEEVRAKTLKDVETAYRTAVQREKLLSDAVAIQKQEANILNEYAIQYNILKQEADSNKQLYDGMLQHMKEAEISAGLKSNNIHIVDPAIPPSSPILPNKNGNLIKATLSGLIFGIAVAFFFEYVGSYSDRSLKTPEDVDRFVKLPFLGLIPSTQSIGASNGRKSHSLSRRTREGIWGKSGFADSGKHQSIELITLCNTKSMISEAYRHLRTSILLSTNGQGPRSIAVASSKRGEGKTNTCINLAITLAQANKKVLLMDCDLRNPKINRILGLNNNEGASTFLAGKPKPLNRLIRQTHIPNLFVLTSGQIPPNPSELIGSPLMKKCLSVLSQRFDHIMIDTPPLLAVTDASILANMVDGVILVIRGGDTTKEAIARSKQLLSCAQARVIGTMLNNVDIHTCEPNYYSRYFYGYDIESTSEEYDDNYYVAGETQDKSS
jgi:succinoglycan biosynthesis transport protein ExoP